MSAAFDSGLERGTVLLEINRQPVDVGRGCAADRPSRDDRATS